MSHPSTPGPWFTGNAPTHSAKVYAKRPGNNVRLVADCEQHGWIPKSREENRANACLVAAAPDLLAESEAYLYARTVPERLIARDRLIAATRKARGITSDGPPSLQHP